MDRETEQWYENFFTLFMTDGWKQLMENVDEALIDADSVTATADEKDLFFRKGKLEVLAQMRNLENTLEMGYNEAKGDVDASAA